MGAIDRARRARGYVDVDDRRESNVDEDSGGGDDRPDEIPKTSASMIAKALRPAYGADFCGGDENDAGDGGGCTSSSRRSFEAAVAEALMSECGIDCSSTAVDQEKGGGKSEGNRDRSAGLVGFEEFRAVARRLVGNPL